MHKSLSRRRLLGHALTGMAATTVVAATPRWAKAAAPAPIGEKLLRSIPSTGEQIPSVGMGTWITFNIGPNPTLRAQRTEVLRRFFAHGGGMIDSSPMYGTAEDVLGHCLAQLQPAEGLFSASKVWTDSAGEGIEQLEDSFRLWGLQNFSLMQVHNLVNWQAHLPMLHARKQEGRLRYVGITTSHGSRHGALAEVMADDRVDFVQLTYNVLDRQAEERLLPLAADLGKAVIVNRPFRRGALTERLEPHPLPGWAAEINATSWAQVLLKFVLAHPAVTCAIPATSKVAHMEENMRAMEGPLPDAALRQRIIADIEAL
ncbi:MAG: aldo/keto reductase [Rhodospirillaceae bacterium]